MVSFDDFLFQIVQPYFLYSVVFLSIACVSIKVFIKFNPYLSRRHKSIIWLAPLFIPVTIIVLFHPQIVINTSPFVSHISPPAGMGIATLSKSFFSFTGLLCISGAVAATVYFGLMLCLGRRIAFKRFHVVMMAQDEYVPLQAKVKEIVQKLGISEPKVGLIDDLLPNAFTVGWGRKTVIVFSLGLLNILNLDELTAVVSHELAHLKAKDFLFKTTAYSLSILSFFNPLSYFALSQSQKERELLADENGVALLDKPNMMIEVLTKVEAAVQRFPKPSFADRLSSSLFLVSPFAHRPIIFASHPQITQRIQNIRATVPVPSKSRRYMIVTAFLLGILCTGIVAGYSTVQAQQVFSQKANDALVSGQSFYLYNISYTFDPTHPTGIFFANESDLRYFLSSIMLEGGYVGRYMGVVDGYVITQGFSANCYLDRNGVAHTFTSTPFEGVVVINGQNVVVNGQRPFIGNISYPFDPANPRNVYLANELSSGYLQAFGYIDGNGTVYHFQAPIIGVYFDQNGACIPIYWPDPPPTWCSYTDIFG